MGISVRSLVSGALVCMYFGLFQGGLYFMKNRFQEIALALVLGLNAYALMQLALRSERFPWQRWLGSSALIALLLIGVPALTFHLHTGAGIFPSMLAGRHYLIALAAPALYLLYRLGFGIREHERCLFAAFVLLVLNYLFHYWRLDLQAAYLSGDHLLANMVTFDEWRGFRLKAPYYVLLVLMLYSVARLSQSGPLPTKAGLLAVLLMSGWIFSIVMTRAALLAVGVAVFSYPLFFRTRSGRLLLVVAIPPCLLVLWGVVSALAGPVSTALASDWSFQVRMESWQIAWDQFLAHPLFGYGQASYYSVSYQALFGRKFFPTDLGIVGVAFKYGMAGVALYFGILFWTVSRLVRAHWMVLEATGRTAPLLWALLVLMMSLVVNAGLQPALTMASGLGMCSVALAYTGMIFHAGQEAAPPSQNATRTSATVSA